MSKIVRAVNAMVSNSQKINEVVAGVSPNEYFFKYDAKHKWSIQKGSENAYILRYYPGNIDLEVVAAIYDHEWAQQEPLNVVYTSKELGTTEAIESLRELYGIVQEKVLGMDDVLNDIIRTDVPF